MQWVFAQEVAESLRLDNMQHLRADGSPAAVTSSCPILSSIPATIPQADLKLSLPFQISWHISKQPFTYQQSCTLLYYELNLVSLLSSV